METALVIAAHPDDEVLGCGATMARLADEGVEVHVLILADGESSRTGADSVEMRARIALRQKAASASAEILGCANVEIEQMPDNRLDTIPLLKITQRIEETVFRIEPSKVFSHHYGDVNLDHRRIHEAVLAACRPQPKHPVNELYFFEIPSSTEWRVTGSAPPFIPNVYFDVAATLTRKLQALGAYVDEMREFPHARSLEAIEALARWRGATVGTAAAEAFVAGRIII